MKVLRSLKSLRDYRSAQRDQARKVGFVPTMGFLHEGHLSLMKRASRDADCVIASIFVNPLQFGPKEDFKRYPRDLRRDQKLLRRAGVDALFVPSAEEFYPKGFQTIVSLDRLSRTLCGKSRPGHFAGVATVVLKLLNLAQPDFLYLGKKDYQQCRVIEQLILDMGLSTKTVFCPIVREKDGVAMSSRNVFLNAGDRREAARIYEALSKARQAVSRGEVRADKIKKTALQVLKKARHARLDYLEIVDASSLQPVVKLASKQRAVMAAAVYFAKTRLIDNVELKAL